MAFDLKLDSYTPYITAVGNCEVSVNFSGPFKFDPKSFTEAYTSNIYVCKQRNLK